MEVYGQHHDLEQVRALLGHARLETTQVELRFEIRTSARVGRYRVSHKLFGHFRAK